MAGALAERVFAEKITDLGFRDVEIVDRTPIGIDDVASYPLFTPELIELMRKLLPPATQAEVAVAVTLRARK